MKASDPWPYKNLKRPPERVKPKARLPTEVLERMSKQRGTQEQRDLYREFQAPPKKEPGA
jgi:hypothetical protein